MGLLAARPTSESARMLTPSGRTGIGGKFRRAIPKLDAKESENDLTSD